MYDILSCYTCYAIPLLTTHTPLTPRTNRYCRPEAPKRRKVTVETTHNTSRPTCAHHSDNFELQMSKSELTIPKNNRWLRNKMHKQIIIALIVLRPDGYHGFNRSRHNPPKFPSSSSPLRVASTTAWATSNDGLGEYGQHLLVLVVFNLPRYLLGFLFSNNFDLCDNLILYFVYVVQLKIMPPVIRVVVNKRQRLHW